MFVITNRIFKIIISIHKYKYAITPIKLRHLVNWKEKNDSNIKPIFDTIIIILKYKLLFSFLLKRKGI